MPSSTTSTTLSSTWFERLQDFAEKHWRLILISSVASIAVGGVSLYALRGGRGGDKKSKKRFSQADLRLSGSGDDVAVTDLPDVEAGDGKFVATSEGNHAVNLEAEVEDSSEVEALAKDIDYSQLSPEEIDKLAQAAKARGNKYFAGQRYDKAITLYTKAIELYPASDPKCGVFYSNRAACWFNLNEFDKVIEDASTALHVDPTYVKAMIRRGNAYEKKEMFSEALADLTTACILEEFKVQSTLMAADRSLKGLVAVKSKELYAQNKRHELPSLAFVSAYLNSFRYDYAVKSSDEFVAGSGDALYTKAVKSFARKDWEKAEKLVSQAVDASPQTTMARALNMRGTFAFLKGASEAAKEDFEESLRIEPSVNTFVKMASVFMEMNMENGIKDATEWFDRALALDPNDPDVYYHRGQIYFLVQNYESAQMDYEKSLELDNDFVLAKIQLAIVKYRLGQVDEASQIFEAAKRAHPKSSDVFYYHGEILLDQQQVDEALAQFDRAIAINPGLPLPYLNKGIIFFHLKNDADRAIEFTQKAIEVDSRCDLAYTHLAQMFMQQGKLDESIITYKRAVDLARTLGDIENAIMGLEATRAQSAAVARINQMKAARS